MQKPLEIEAIQLTLHFKTFVVGELSKFSSVYLFESETKVVYFVNESFLPKSFSRLIY